MTLSLDGSPSFLQVTRTTIKAWMSLNFHQIPSPTTESATQELLKKLMYKVVAFLVSSFLMGSFILAAIKSLMSSNFGKIRPKTADLAALHCLERFT